VNVSAALKSRAAAIIVGAFAFLAIFFVLAGPSWGLALYRLLFEGALAILWIAAAAGIGWIFLRTFLKKEPIDSLSVVTAIGLGMGIIGLIVLALGLLGWMNGFWAIVIFALGDLIAIAVAYQRSKYFDVGAWLRSPCGIGRIGIAAAAVGSVIVLAACFPPGILWADEPNGYDVVEYHLQVPREWFEAGRIVPLHHNVFSYFPFNVEIHYLLAMYLHGGPWAGMYLAQFMHIGFCALAAWATCVAAGGKAPGIIAGVLVLAVPWTGLLAPVAYNEGGTLFFIALAIAWIFRGKSWRNFAVAGIFAGLAAGTKLSWAPLVFLGFPLAEIVRNRRNYTGIFTYLLAALLALSPWLVKDWLWSGNPVFPEAMSVLGSDGFSAVQVQRWQQAYQPDPKYRTPHGQIRAIWYEVLADWRYGYIMFPLAGVAWYLARGRRSMRFLEIALVFQFIFWTEFTHLQSRFMTPVIPILALMIAAVKSRPWIALCACAAVVLSCFTAIKLVNKLDRYLEIDHTGTVLIGRENLEGFRLLDTRRLGDRHVDLVGDACAFWYQIPMSQLHYKTVFDVDTSNRNQSIEQAWLAGMPKDAVIWRDEDELKRFARTYYGIPSPK
jgi:hypothetical protein